jgi:hypothetical protein
MPTEGNKRELDLANRIGRLWCAHLQYDLRCANVDLFSTVDLRTWYTLYDLYHLRTQNTVKFGMTYFMHTILGRANQNRSHDDR